MLPRFPLKQEFKNMRKQGIKNSNQNRQFKSNLQIGEQPVQNNGFGSVATSSTKSPYQIKSILQRTSLTMIAQDSKNILVERFAELYENLDSGDVLIVCGRNHDVLKAHRYVLSCGSLYFRKALTVIQFF